VMSATPPAANGSTKRTGRLGYAWARAMLGIATVAVAKPAENCLRVSRVMFILLDQT